MLGLPYRETLYRAFGSRLIRYVLDGTLALQGSRLRVYGHDIGASGLSPAWRRGQEPLDEEAAWHLLRHWAGHHVSAQEARTPWGYDWLAVGGASLPRQGALAAYSWRDLLTEWVRTSYLRFWQGRAESYELDDTCWTGFWRLLWQALGAEFSFDADATWPAVAPEVERLVSEGAALGAIPSGMAALCQRAGVQWTGVPLPWWAVPVFSEWLGPEEPPDWDLPLRSLGKVAGQPATVEEVVQYVDREHPALIAGLEASIADSKTHRTAYGILFPILGHTLPPSTRVEFGEGVALIGLSEAQATGMSEASGVRPVGDLSPGDGCVTVDVEAESLEAAYGVSLRGLARVQALLRQADGAFRWAVDERFYVRISSPDHTDRYFVQWRDNYQLKGPLDPKHLTHLRDLALNIDRDGRQLAKALKVAMQWQGLARVQDSIENKFLCLWIALERLGNGSFHYKDTIPRMAATLWHQQMWSVLPSHERPVCYYHDQMRMRILVHDLSQIRSSDIVHRGEVDARVDMAYATWALESLTQDLTFWMLRVVRETTLRTFDDLLRTADGLSGLLPS